jgi:hypothetical protein
MTRLYFMCGNPVPDPLSGKKSLRIDTNDPAGFKVVEKK